MFEKKKVETYLDEIDGILKKIESFDLRELARQGKHLKRSKKHTHISKKGQISSRVYANFLKKEEGWKAFLDTDWYILLVKKFQKNI